MTMKSLDHYKKTEPALEGLSDEEALRLCDDFQQIAQLAFEEWVLGSKYRQWFLPPEITKI